MPSRVSTGFDGVTIVPFAAADGNWRAYINGQDTGTGTLWYDSATGNSDLINTTNNSFRFQVDDGQTLTDYVTCEIQAGAAEDGGNALYMEVTLDDPVNSDTSRCKYQLRPGLNFNGGPFEEGYASFYLKLQSDLADVQTTGWREVCAMTNEDQDKTVFFQIVVSEGEFIWRLAGKPCLDDCASDWTVDNSTVAVPINEWFRVEFAFSSGYVGVKINGTLVAEYGTAYIVGIRTWDVVSLYSAVTEAAAGAISQHLDGLEISLGTNAIPHEWSIGFAGTHIDTTSGGGQGLLRNSFGGRRRR